MKSTARERFEEIKDSNLSKYEKMRKWQEMVAIEKGILNPYRENREWTHASTSEMLKNYRKVISRVNSQMDKYEKQGIAEYSPQYQKLVEDGMRSGRQEGNVRIPRINMREFKKLDENTQRIILTKEYKYVFNIYTSKSYEIKDLKRYIKQNFAHIGVDVKETRKRLQGNEEALAKFDKELSNYWKLYNAFVNQGLLEEFNLKSDVVQEIVSKYVEKYGNPNVARGMVAASVKSKLRQVKSDSKDSADIDKAVYNQIVGESENSEDNLDRLEKESDRLLYMLTKKAYAHKAPADTTPKRARINRNKK